MRAREKERFLRLNFDATELKIRDRLYKARKHAEYKIKIYEEKGKYDLGYYTDNPDHGYYIDTVYFRTPDEYTDIIKLYEGLFYILYKLSNGKIGYGMLDPDSPVEEIRSAGIECSGVCEHCFWRGMLYGEEKTERVPGERYENCICYKERG